jgi:hypothetical protein
MTKKIDFQCGDIRKIDTLYDKESVDILLFRNAMYHILCKYNEDDDRIELDDSEQIADLIAHKMFEILKKDGKIIGVCFMNMFADFGWLEKINFDCVIDGTLIPMVQK